MAIEFKVEAGVPIPDRYGQSKYPFRDMRVGDSFAIPLTEVNLCAGLSTAASYYGNRNGFKYTTRVDRAAGVRRCWRIE